MSNLLGMMLFENGYKVLRIGCKPDETIFLRKYVPHYVIEHFPKLIEVEVKAPDLVVVRFPALNPFQFRLGGGWKELFVVHRVYGTGVRDCVRLGIEAWSYVKRQPVNAFVQKLPVGVEPGVEVNGVHLFEAEWMCANAVAVG